VDLVTGSEQRFPSGHRVGTDDGATVVSEFFKKGEERLELLLRGGEIDPLVLRRTTVILQKLNIML
jgi:hypothetical protein